MRKKITAFLLAAMMCVSLCGCVSAPAYQEPTQTEETEDADAVLLVLDVCAADETEEPAPTEDIQAAEDFCEAWEEDYMALMVESCMSGDIEAGRRAEAERSAKITALALEVPKISFDDLYELSKVICNEAGSYWLPMDWKMMVGEVVLNRVASEEFPNTIGEVVHQRGQYSGANSARFEELVPSADCVEAAKRLLTGERLINDPSVVFQANFKQGSGTYLRLHDRYCGYTYLCYSSYPELYQSDNQEDVWKFF